MVDLSDRQITTDGQVGISDSLPPSIGQRLAKPAEMIGHSLRFPPLRTAQGRNHVQGELAGAMGVAVAQACFAALQGFIRPGQVIAERWPNSIPRSPAPSISSLRAMAPRSSEDSGRCSSASASSPACMAAATGRAVDRLQRNASPNTTAVVMPATAARWFMRPAIAATTNMDREATR